jgi:hypothetical protein
MVMRKFPGSTGHYAKLALPYLQICIPGDIISTPPDPRDIWPGLHYSGIWVPMDSMFAQSTIFEHVNLEQFTFD